MDTETKKDGHFQKKGELGNIKEEGFYFNGVKEGVWFEWGKLLDVGEYKSGLKNGEWISYEIPLWSVFHGGKVYDQFTGEVVTCGKVTYLNGILHGDYVGENGTGKYENGLKTGLWKEGNYNNAVTCHYLNDILHGKYIEEDRITGETIELEYENGYVNGYEIIKYKDGKIKSIAFYIKNYLIGTKVNFDIESNLIRIENSKNIILFNDNKIIQVKECIKTLEKFKITFYDKDEKITSIEFYDWKNDIYSYENYNEDGTILNEHYIKNYRENLSSDWNDIWHLKNDN